MNDLDRLIAAVEAGGDVAKALYNAIPSHAEIPTRHLVARIINNGKDLTAALGLHEALLPGWFWSMRPLGFGVSAMVWADEKRVSEALQDAPARAWLLAILRAVKAQQEAGK